MRWENWHKLRRRCESFLREEIWRPLPQTARSGKALVVQVTRVGLVLGEGLERNRLLVRAAALSYSSLLGMAPLIALGVMVAGFALDKSEPERLGQLLERAVVFVAPQFGETAAGATEAGEDGINPELLGLIEGIIASSQSGAVGVAGIATLIVIAIQLLTSVEKTFNDIWGVRRGRKFHERVFLYWAFITLAAVIIGMSATLLSARTFVGLSDTQPMESRIIEFTWRHSPILSFLAVGLGLSAFYRFIVNAVVPWRSALVGGFTVAVLLGLNNALSIIYVQRVVINRSLYGSVGILPILMIGLYVFWLIVLFGGQLTYAIQNARSHAREQAWSGISTRARDLLSLTIFVLVCRRFAEESPPVTVNELQSTTRTPAQIVNQCLDRLAELGWIALGSPVDRSSQLDDRPVLPARPLGRITLEGLARSLDEAGNNAGISSIDRLDPIVHAYAEEHYGGASDAAERTIQEWLDAYPNAPGAQELGEEDDTLS